MSAENPGMAAERTSWQAFPGTVCGASRSIRRLAWVLPVACNGLWHRFGRSRTARQADEGQCDPDRVEQGSFVPGSAPSGARRARTRITCWNIAYGRRYRQILKALREDVPADVYLLQEVDSGCGRSCRRAVARCLAQELHLHYAFGIEFYELAESRNGRPGLHGQAILSRYPLERVRLLRFAHQEHDWSDDLVQPRRGGRIALVASVAIGGEHVTLYNTHLESRGSPAGRARQLDEVVADLRVHGGEGPAIIAGDLNTRRDAAPGQPAGYLASHPVFGAAAQHAVASLGGSDIGANWFLVRGAHAQSVPVPAHRYPSDHEPLMLELRLTGRS